MYLKQGQKLHNGKYQLLDVLGEGGFSLTYKGIWRTTVQGPLGKVPARIPVCIKEYFLKDYCVRERNSISVGTARGKEIFDKNKEYLIKEANILSEIHHPNTVSVLEVFKENNTIYIVMEFVSGLSLKQKVEESGVLSESELLKIIFEIGGALHFVHDKNILHLDIKPANILINNLQKPILIDFGISKRYDLLDSQETSTSLLAVSKGYTAIEQYDNEGIKVFSPRPDIYSLGATMYYALTGIIPTESILRMTKGLKNPRELNPSISEKTEQVILKAMSLDPKDRYDSVLEMLDDLGYDSKLKAPVENDLDRTVLLENNFNSGIGNEDETVLVEKKKKRKKWYLFSLVLLPVGILLSYVYAHKKDVREVDMNEINYKKHFELGKDQYYKQNFSQSKEEFHKALQFKDDDPEARRYLDKIDSLYLLVFDANTEGSEEIPAGEEQPEMEILPIETSDSKKIPDTESTKSTDLTDENNEDLQLFGEAMVDFENENYESAMKKFEKITDSSLNSKKYIQLIESKLKAREINQRKESYELKMKFGTFVIVRNKETRLYGAINDEGYEVIACKYVNLDPAGSNKAFLRKDTLYDVYTPDGTLFLEGVADY